MPGSQEAQGPPPGPGRWLRHGAAGVVWLSAAPRRHVGGPSSPVVASGAADAGSPCWGRWPRPVLERHALRRRAARRGPCGAGPRSSPPCGWHIAVAVSSAAVDARWPGTRSHVESTTDLAGRTQICCGRRWTSAEGDPPAGATLADLTRPLSRRGRASGERRRLLDLAGAAGRPGHRLQPGALPSRATSWPSP